MARASRARVATLAPLESRLQASDAAASDGRARLERRNLRLHVLEGASMIGALGAINSNTVGTSLVESLGGSAWMVALMPMAATLGFSIGPILTAHRLDRESHFLPALRRSLPFSRLPILLTAIVLFVCGAGPLSLWTVLLSSVVYGVIGGLSVGAWQQLILRTVRPDQRSSLFATRYLVSNVLALAVASAVGPILSRWPGTRGYGILHVIAFVGAMVSYRLLMGVREPQATLAAPVPKRDFLENLRGVPELFAGDRRLRGYLVAVVLINSQFLLMGFLAVHALETLRQGHSYVGNLTSAQMVGAVIGTWVTARVANRCCSRTLLLAARLLLLGVALGAIITTSDYAFRLLFAMYGAAVWINLVGHNTLSLELLPAARRSTVLAVFSLVQVPSMLLAAELGAWLWHAGVSFTWIAGLSAVGIAASMLTLLPGSPVLLRDQGSEARGGSGAA